MPFEGISTMFTNFKNKIKEETGHDVSRLEPVVNTAQCKLGNRGRISQEGSTCSLSSFSIDGNKDETNLAQVSNIKLADGTVLTQKEFKKLESKEDEWRKKLEKKEEEFRKIQKKMEEEWKKQSEDKQKEWKKKLDRKEKEKLELENVKSELRDENSKLKQDLKLAEEYKRKLSQCQEDIDQLEGFQTQELAKIKHLLLFKEQETAEKDKQLKDALSQIELLKCEMLHLRKMEQEYVDVKDHLETVRHTFDMEKKDFVCHLNEKDEKIRYLNDRIAVLEERTKAEFIGLGAQLTPDERIQALYGERTLLERRLEESHLQLSEIKSSCYGKISSLENQLERVSRQACEESSERRKAETLIIDLNQQINVLEKEIENLKLKLEKKDVKLDRLKCEMKENEESLKDSEMKHNEEIEILNMNIKKQTEEKITLEEKLKLVEENNSQKTRLLTSLEEEHSKCKCLEKELVKLKNDVELEKGNGCELRKLLDLEKCEKDEIMMRNAQISQQFELTKQQLKTQNVEVNELQIKINCLDLELQEKEKEIDSYQNSQKKLDIMKNLEEEKVRLENVESELKTNISQLEDQLSDKNKTIKVLQSRLLDMKKTLQRELKLSSDATNDDMLTTYSPAACSGSNTTAIITPSSSVQHPHNNKSYHQTNINNQQDVNFVYLKHVLMKFLTSREYEAQHLTRAVATLLRFSSEEEKLLRETLEWKMSWFGSKPNLGNGQTCKTIPPS